MEWLLENAFNGVVAVLFSSGAPKPWLSSFWFIPRYFHKLVISILLNKYDYPLYVFVTLPRRTLRCLGSRRSSLRENVYVCTAANPKPPQWNCCLDPGGTVSVHPDFTCRDFWLHIQLYMMTWKVRCSLEICYWWAIWQFIIILRCHPGISEQSALEISRFGNEVLEELFEDAWCQWVIKCWFLTLIIILF